MEKKFTEKRKFLIKELPENKKKLYNDFVKGIKEKMNQSDFKDELQKIINILKVNYKHKDSMNAVEDILGNVNNLLIQFGFVKSLDDVKKNNRINKPKISKFIGGRLNVIQLEPYKNGAALVIFLEKRNQNDQGDKVGITIRPVAEEGEDGGLKGNILPETSVKDNNKDNEIWSNVSGGVAKQLYSK